MRTAVLVLAAAALALPVHSETGPVLQVEFSNPGLSPSHWILIIHPDGNGHFRSDRGNAPAKDPQTIEAPNVDRDIQLSAGFAERVFQTVHNRNWFNVDCESHLKVAFQGWKKLSYSGPDGQGVCAFNYSRDKEIQALGDSLVSVAGTILTGARLEMLLQHDPLGLDRETEYLVEAARDGRAQQIYAIRGILERLAEDQGVMERVRKRARVLLADAEK
jgi:hypothetical protein